MNLITIARGWYHYISGSGATRNLIEERLSICENCPYKRQLSITGKWIVQSINGEGSIFFCGYCGCALAAKTADKSQSCPLGKWSQQSSTDSYYS